jgi:hypothetical protein
MNNYWLKQAEKKEMMAVEQTIERMQNLVKSLMPRKNKIRTTKQMKELLVTKSGHTIEMVDELYRPHTTIMPRNTLTDEEFCNITVSYDIYMKELQKEVERIEAEGWVLDV